MPGDGAGVGEPARRGPGRAVPGDGAVPRGAYAVGGVGCLAALVVGDESCAEWAARELLLFVVVCEAAAVAVGEV